MNVLVLNCGSSSIKYQVVHTDDGSVLARGAVERIGEPGGEHTDHGSGLERVLSDAAGHRIDAVGHRVVHGGADFHDARRLDDEVIAAIKACVPLAPLHNPANLAGIAAARAALPAVPQVAVFDTAFHARLPRRARLYAIDHEIAERYGVRRYGFHGTSHAWVAARAAQHLEVKPTRLRLITCHLGSGASICAVEGGKSTETSMGMTPLEGLVMGTRSGDIDPGVVLQLVRELGVDAVDTLLNRKSGLKGLSGRANDLRDIEHAADDGDERARAAIAVFAHRVRKYIGAYAAAMGGVDAIVMTAGIGENSPAMRRRILQRFEYLGLVLDAERNRAASVEHARPVVDISADHSRVRALVIATNEELAIARETARIVGGAKQVHRPGPIPVAISARHVHLDRRSMDVLFGKGSNLSVLKPISQPGQFASDQTVTVVGPRNRIEGVRVLGPLRSATQVEVSRTDEFKLGVDAPIRDSGHVQGSAPITLVGPAGTLKLEHGLICARRHIHMTPDDARVYGVHDGDEVEVAITGGPRDLVFGDVLVRVKPSYRLEMHIDTDEANAAELSRGASAGLVYVSPASGHGELRRRR